jgi:hypothetical protein
VVRARLGGAIPEMIEAIARGVPDDASRARPVYQQRLADAVTGAIVAYLDELAAACAQGYAEARAQAAGDRQRQLIGTILSEPPPGAELLASLAGRSAGRCPPGSRSSSSAAGSRTGSCCRPVCSPTGPASRAHQ